MCDVGSVVDPTGWGAKYFQPTSDAKGGLLSKGVALGENLNLAARYGLDPAQKYFSPMVHNFLGIGSDDAPTVDFSQEEGYLRNGLSNFDDWSSQYTDPAKYQASLNEQEANGRTKIGGQYANVGMAGSSAAMGAQANNDRLTELAGWDKQLSDRSQIEQIRNMYTTGLTNIDIGKMNNDAAAKAAAQQQIGQIVGAVGTVAGGIYGGPAGAAVGSQAGKIIPGQNYTPMGYQQAPQYDFSGGYAPSPTYDSFTSTANGGSGYSANNGYSPYGPGY